MSATTVSTRFLVLSDTHNFEFDDATGAFRQPVPKTEVLLHCGDLTMCGGLSAYKKSLKMLGSIDAESKIVIAGNHDLSLDGEYWQANLEDDDDPKEHSYAMEIMTGPLAKQAGVTYVQEGTHTFTLRSGAKFTIYTSPYQPEFGDWAFPYKRDQDRFITAAQAAPNFTSIAQNLIPDFPSVDIVMTHGPQEEFLTSVPKDT